jgi:hypothetical protein
LPAPVFLWLAARRERVGDKVSLSGRGLERYAWGGGVVFVAALVAETVFAVGVRASQNDSAARTAMLLHEHHQRLIAIAGISILYAAGFTIYLTCLHDVLRMNGSQPRFLGSLLLIGGVLFVTLHAVSDIGITGMMGAKVASYSAARDPGLSYALYLLTFALDSVGDVFGSLFAFATGWLVLASRILPRWLGWIAILVAPLLFLQGFGLGGVISSFGLILDLIGFLLLLVFVLASSIIFLRHPSTPDSAPATA